MLCGVCNKKAATVHFKQVVNGVSQEMNICADCAKNSGISVTAPLGLTDMLLGMGANTDSTASEEANKACAACHMRLGDLRKTHRLGCPECYGAFADELAPMIEAMHRDTRHSGKVPESARAVARIAAMQAELQKAVDEQRFEDAARLRDEIRGLRGKNGCEA
jgi:protein arginine kinase activator